MSRINIVEPEHAVCIFLRTVRYASRGAVAAGALCLECGHDGVMGLGPGEKGADRWHRGHRRLESSGATESRRIDKPPSSLGLRDAPGRRRPQAAAFRPIQYPRPPNICHGR